MRMQCIVLCSEYTGEREKTSYYQKRLIFAFFFFLQRSHARYVDSSCLSFNAFKGFKLSNILPKAVSERLHIRIALIVEKRQQKSFDNFFVFYFFL